MNRLPLAVQRVTQLKGKIVFCSESTRDVVRTQLSRGPALKDFLKSSAAETELHGAQFEKTPYLQEHDLAAKGRKGSQMLELVYLLLSVEGHSGRGYP